MENKKQRELIHQLVDRILDVQEQTNNYASVRMSNYGNFLSIEVKEGEWEASKDYSLIEDFNKTILPENVRFRRMLDYLDSLISKEASDDEKSLPV